MHVGKGPSMCMLHPATGTFKHNNAVSWRGDRGLLKKQQLGRRGRKPTQNTCLGTDETGRNSKEGTDIAIKQKSEAVQPVLDSTTTMSSADGMHPRSPQPR
jgi:hypothetical protein